MIHAAHSRGKLYLIPTHLGEPQARSVLPASVSQQMDLMNHFIVENEKTARRAIKTLLPNKAQASLELFPLNKHTAKEDLPTYLEPCKLGFDMGLLSEAGCPGIADPGAEIVKLAHLQGIQVVPLVGPSSILLALMASGLNGQNFSFHGYLPIDTAEKKARIRQLEKNSLEEVQAQLFIETPYRNNKLLEDLKRWLHPATQLCVACDLTLETEEILTQSVSQWKNTRIDLQKRPAIFILQRLS